MRETRQESSTSDFVVCMEMSAWVPALSEDGRNILRTETRTSPISRAVVDRELLQLSATSKSRRAHQTRPKDNSQRNCSAAWSGAPCGPGDDGRFWNVGKFVLVVFPVCLRVRRNQNVWNCFPIHLTVRISPPTRLTRQSRKPCEARCEELEQISTAEASLRFCNAGRYA
jgi:hypothetical protein